MPENTARLSTALADRYKIERHLGEGGMANVYLAEDLKHKRKVAVKVLRPELSAVLGGDRFLNEIKVTANLQHPHILPLFDSGEADSFLYYVMPFIDGETLRDKLNYEKQLSIEETVEITKVIAGALDYAHKSGVIHRDIKPENILLQDGVALMADFGIAIAVKAAGGERLTETGLSLGTPSYMSPEQIAGQRDLDARSDVYSLACVTYEMLAGDPPFIASTAQAVMAKHVTDPAAPITTTRPSASPSIANALAKALNKTPVDRYESAGAFAAGLTKEAEGQDREAKSIAVLPFTNLSADPENEYFSDGITEDIIAQLSRIGELKVISRTSVMRYKKTDKSTREIGAELGAASVLEGSVRRAGDRVRVVAQLNDAATDQHLWAETYDRELTDIFAIQSELALRIAAALETELSPDERVLLEDHAAADRAPRPEAYEAYLRGRFHWSQHTPEGIRNALRYFELALEKHPQYALAHMAIGDVWGARTHLGLVAPREAYPTVKTGALKAIELDDTIAETHDAVGRMRFWFEWNWEDAELAFQRSIQVNGNHAEVRGMYSFLLSITKRWQEATVQVKRGLELDPLSPLLHWILGLTLLLQRRYDEAIDRFRSTLQMEPTFLLAHLGLWTSFHHEDLHEDALLEAKKYFEALLDHEGTDALTGGSAGGGYVASMLRAAEKLAGRFDQSYVAPTRVARLYTYAGEGDVALQWLEKAYEERDFEMVYLDVHPDWENLRSDPRFQALVRQMNFRGSSA